ncbi:MAG: gluconate 2-dehydrogenase subunit 3 family protein [Acidobacteria bacterium]|nr:gluconate 2-dehydrogenase subunit 3 family protein [Acidobacteriota bacterium]
MKRRRFIQTLAAAPAIAVPASLEAKANPSAGAQRPQEEAPKLETAPLDAAGETTPRFFSAPQFAALRKLSGIILPPLNGMPGALDAGAPEFLDFLIGKSPADRQQLYKAGLDALNAQATKRFGKAFAEVTDAQAAELLAPLKQPWTYEPPADPFARFLREVKQDVRNATMNSREYTAASSSGGRRGGGLGQYWYPID